MLSPATIMPAGLRSGLVVALLLCGCGALAKMDDRRWGAAPLAGLPASASGGPTSFAYFVGNGTDGRGARVCYTIDDYKQRYGTSDPYMSYMFLGRVRVAGNDTDAVVPSARGPGNLPTAADVAAWATPRFWAAGMENLSSLIPATPAAGPPVDWVDSLGVRHVRLVQYSECYRAQFLDFAPVTVHLRDGHTAFYITGSYLNAGCPKSTVSGAPETAAFSKPRLSKAEGAAAALRAVIDTSPGIPPKAAAALLAAAASPSEATLSAANAQPDTRMGVFCSSSRCDLAYSQVVLVPPTPSSGPKELHVYVSAEDGSLLQAANRLRTQFSQAVVGSGRGLYIGRAPYTPGPARLRTGQDPARKSGKKFAMYDWKWGFVTLDIHNKGRDATNTAMLMLDADNAWGDGTSRDRATLAVDAHWGMSITLEYYKNVHGRHSIDNRGVPLTSYMHVYKNYNNAFYSNNAMYYGDGNLKGDWLTTCADVSGSKGYPPYASLDTVGHELTHGVTEYSSGLNYFESSGGINEAMSDIMAQCVSNYAFKTNQTLYNGANFYVGKQEFDVGCQGRPNPKGFLRSFINPQADGGMSWSCWDPLFDSVERTKSSDFICESEVHLSSGVANRAFWLVAQGFNTACNKGSKPAAIGIEKACAVFYRANTAYLTQTSDFYELRMATAHAAADMFGDSGPEVQATQAAWDTVGAPRAPFPQVDAPQCEPFFATDPSIC